MSQTHRCFADEAIPEFNTNVNANLDPTDLTDADMFEELEHNIEPFPIVIRDQANMDEMSYVPLGPEEPANQTEEGNLETMSAMVIDKFLHSSAGAAIPGMAHPQESYQDTHTDSVWAPFNSRLDWLFAQWAKIHGSMSSAVTRLLEIPEVCACVTI
jgi:hypothetical protein